MQLKNTTNRYGLISITLHWVMAIIIIALLAEGIYMVRLQISLEKLKLFGWHKEWGLLILGLALIRVAWWCANTVPVLPAHLAHWQKTAAHLVHFSLYCFMFALPLTGWMMSSATGLPVSFFGWLVLPDLAPVDESWRIGLVLIHQWLGYGLIAVLCAHVGAALQHHFIHKDDILRRMLP